MGNAKSAQKGGGAGRKASVAGDEGPLAIDEEKPLEGDEQDPQDEENPDGEPAEGEEGDERKEGEGQPGVDTVVDVEQKPKAERLKEWFRVFKLEQDADRQGVSNWARLCIWRYFWDYLFEVRYSDPLDDEKVWGRPLVSIHERHNNIKHICEVTMRKMPKKSRDRVVGQLCAFSDLQGPDVYWSSELRSTGLAGLDTQEAENLDNLKTITDNFGVLMIDLASSPTMPLLGRWHSAEFKPVDEEAVPEGADNDNEDVLKVTLRTEGWEDLKLITAINLHPRVKRLRAIRQKIRMLHAQKVTILMKHCVRCGAKREEGKSNCYVEGTLQFNMQQVADPAHNIIDYDPAFTFQLVHVDRKNIHRCGRSCQGSVKEEMFQTIESDKFFISSLLNNSVPPAAAALWEAALRRRRTCGLSFHFYVGVFSHPDMCKQPFDVCKEAVKRCEGSKSIIYTDLYEDTNPKIATALKELYKRMDTICSQNDHAYWFKFWITACKALFPDSSKVPPSMWEFDFVSNQRAICFRMMERPVLEELLRNSGIFDNPDLYLSKEGSVGRLLNDLYRNMAVLKKQGNTDGSKRTDADGSGDVEGTDGKAAGGGKGGKGGKGDGKGGDGKTSAEFDQLAAASAACMDKLISVQSRLAQGVIDKARAREEMAELALANPLVFNAVGGGDAVRLLAPATPAAAPAAAAAPVAAASAVAVADPSEAAALRAEMAAQRAQQAALQQQLAQQQQLFLQQQQALILQQQQFAAALAALKGFGGGGGGGGAGGAGAGAASADGSLNAMGESGLSQPTTFDPAVFAALAAAGAGGDGAAFDPAALLLANASSSGAAAAAAAAMNLDAAAFPAPILAGAGSAGGAGAAFAGFDAGNGGGGGAGAFPSFNPDGTIANAGAGARAGAGAGAGSGASPSSPSSSSSSSSSSSGGGFFGGFFGSSSSDTAKISTTNSTANGSASASVSADGKPVGGAASTVAGTSTEGDETDDEDDKLPQIKAPTVKNRLVGSLADNGVEGDGMLEEEEGCSIM